MNRQHSFVSLVLAWMILAAGARGQKPAGEDGQEPLAVVAGQELFEADLPAPFQSQIHMLRGQEFELKSRALENLISQRVLAAEARKRGVAADKLLEQEVDARIGEPSDGEIEAFYLGQKDRMRGPLEDLRSQLRERLRQLRIQQARESYLKQLRDDAGVVIFLRPPKVEVSPDLSRLRGNPDAPVTIVEFSDFQCGYCRIVQDTLRSVLAKYSDRVRLSFRDFPLNTIHPQAQSAAEAARCAGEQGKFWEYHDRLFANPSKLGSKDLAEHAGSLGLDRQRFDACVSSGKYKAAVEADLQQGGRAGVSSTPSFFINGVLLTGAQPVAAFEKIIDAELAARARHPTPR